MKKIVIRMKSIYDIRSLEKCLNTMEEKGYRIKKVGRFHLVFEERGDRPIQKYAVRRCSTRHVSEFLKEYEGVWVKYLIPTKRLLIMASLDNDPIVPPLESQHYKPYGSKFDVFSFWSSMLLFLVIRITFDLVDKVSSTVDLLIAILLILFIIGLLMMSISERVLKISSRIKNDSVLSTVYCIGKTIGLIGGAVFVYKAIERTVDIVKILIQNKHLIGTTEDFLTLGFIILVIVFVTKVIKSVTDD